MCRARGGGGGGVLNKYLYGETPPWGLTSYPFIYHFWRKRYPFRIPSIDEWYPFHIPCLELCIAFNCCKCARFQISIRRKIRTFSRHYKALKFMLALLGPFTDPNDRFPHPFVLQRVKSLPFHIPEAWKRYPFRAEPPRIGHYREYPLSQGAGQVTGLARGLDHVNATELLLCTLKTPGSRQIAVRVSDHKVLLLVEVLNILSPPSTLETETWKMSMLGSILWLSLLVN